MGKYFPTTYTEATQLVNMWINTKEMVSNRKNHEPLWKGINEHKYKDKDEYVHHENKRFMLDQKEDSKIMGINVNQPEQGF